MTTNETQVVTTVQMKARRLDADTIIGFANLLQQQDVRGSAPVDVKIHEGQRGGVEAVVLTATVVHG